MLPCKTVQPVWNLSPEWGWSAAPMGSILWPLSRTPGIPSLSPGLFGANAVSCWDKASRQGALEPSWPCCRLMRVPLQEKLAVVSLLGELLQQSLAHPCPRLLALQLQTACTASWMNILNPRLKRMLTNTAALDDCSPSGPAPATPPSQPHTLCIFPPQGLCMCHSHQPSPISHIQKLKLRVFLSGSPQPEMSSFSQRSTPLLQHLIHATHGNSHSTSCY